MPTKTMMIGTAGVFAVLGSVMMWTPPWPVSASSHADRRVPESQCLGLADYPNSQLSSTIDGSEVNPDSELRTSRPSGRNATASPCGSRRVLRFTLPSFLGRSSPFSVTEKNSRVS